ncbi:MAG: O-antigen ligase family protein, partial [Candidatus Aminicenantes bacterium]|nr:O-antigen ligase family protein [Candidatus Aminicenantes bacterium]
MSNSSGGNPAARKGMFLLAALALAWFFAAFGPAEPGLRALILAAGGLTAAAAVFQPAWGLSAFLFFLMTANNWPYFFQTRHSVFYIPIAAVLFGFLASGLALRRAALFRKSGDGIPPAALPVSVRNPVRFAAAVTAVSAGIACWRWANFFPFRGKEIFDWMTNSDGLPAALARRSVVMTAAGYLLPIAFLAVAVKTMKNRAGVEATLRVSTAGLGLAVAFGYVQHFAALGLGNTDFWVVLNQINATFIDPNAFGGVLAIMLPVLGAAALDGFAGTRGAGKRRAWAAAAAATFVLGLFAFLWIGARSAILAFGAGAAVFALGVLMSRNKHRAEPGAAGDAGALEPAAKRQRRHRWIAAAAVVLLAAGGMLFFRSRLFVRLKERTVVAVKTGDVVLFSPERYFLWKHALAMIRDYPLSGVGVGAYIVELPNYYARDRAPVPAGLEGSQRRDSAENYFLQAGAEAGAVGLAAWIAVFAGLAWEIRRAVRDGVLRGPDRLLYLGAAGGLAAFFVNIIFHSFVQSFETPFCFWLAAA